MQSPDWKFFNVLFDTLNEKQLQYECKGGKTVFEILTSLLKLGLTKPQRSYAPDTKDQDKVREMTQVKSYIMSYLVPKAVNSSLSFLTPQLTLIYIDLLDQAMEIEGHLRDYGTQKKTHFTAIQSMHQQLLDCKGIIFDKNYIDRYDKFFMNFLQTVRIKVESHKRDGYRILKQYMTEYYKQLFAPLTDVKDKEALLHLTVFMSDITS